MRLELTTYRLTAGRAADCAIQELMNIRFCYQAKICTECGDRTHDQSIKSRTLYLTELTRPVMCTVGWFIPVIVWNFFAPGIDTKT